jgi:hypothetical protein
VKAIDDFPNDGPTEQRITIRPTQCNPRSCFNRYGNYGSQVFGHPQLANNRLFLGKPAKGKEGRKARPHEGRKSRHFGGDHHCNNLISTLRQPRRDIKGTP